MKNNNDIIVYMSGDVISAVNSDAWKQMVRSLLKKGQSLKVYYRKGVWKHVPNWIFKLYTSFCKPDIKYIKDGPAYIDGLTGELVKE